MDLFIKEKCKECPFFEWEDEIPDCVFGIDAVEDIDEFNPMHVHEDNDICSQPRIEIQIRFNGPYDGNDLEGHLENIAWLCPENIRLALKQVCKNTRFEVKYSKRFKKELEKWQKKINQ